MVLVTAESDMTIDDAFDALRRKGLAVGRHGEDALIIASLDAGEGQVVKAHRTCTICSLRRAVGPVAR